MAQDAVAVPSGAREPWKAYRRLVVWQKADELAYQVYCATKQFPADERFGLVSQMRRASVSVAANIVEGYTCSSRKERRRFYQIARSSLAELEYFIDFVCERLGYMTQEQHGLLSALRQDVGRLLHGLLKFEHAP
jgi:four helix bundle protein